MSSYFGTWTDLSGPREDRDDWADAWAAIEEADEEPPTLTDGQDCPACGGRGCLVCAAVVAGRVEDER